MEILELGEPARQKRSGRLLARNNPQRTRTLRRISSRACCGRLRKAHPRRATLFPNSEKRTFTEVATSTHGIQFVNSEFLFATGWNKLCFDSARTQMTILAKLLLVFATATISFKAVDSSAQGTEPSNFWTTSLRSDTYEKRIAPLTGFDPLPELHNLA